MFDIFTVIYLLEVGFMPTNVYYADLEQMDKHILPKGFLGTWNPCPIQNHRSTNS